MIVVVSDTSPIRALHHLGLLPVLGKLYGKVVVPPALQNEIVLPARTFQGIDLSGFDFVEVRTPQDATQVHRFLQSLDRGESEALALALELLADAVLIDEADGRRIAAQNGIRTLGTLGILIDAKVKGHIREIRSLIDRLIRESGFFISTELKQRVLELAGE